MLHHSCAGLGRKLQTWFTHCTWVSVVIQALPSESPGSYQVPPLPTSAERLGLGLGEPPYTWMKSVTIYDF